MFNLYNDLKKKATNLQSIAINNNCIIITACQMNKNKQNIMETKKVLTLKNLCAELQIESSRKGMTPEKYLENLISEINKSSKYIWSGFFQLVDVFYVVVSEVKKDKMDEIKSNYETSFLRKPSISSKEEIHKETSKEISDAKITTTDIKKTLYKHPFPWQGNQ